MSWHYESCPACNGVGMIERPFLDIPSGSTVPTLIRESCQVCDGERVVKVPDGYRFTRIDPLNRAITSSGTTAMRHPFADVWDDPEMDVYNEVIGAANG